MKTNKLILGMSDYYAPWLSNPYVLGTGVKKKSNNTVKKNASDLMIC